MYHLFLCFLEIHLVQPPMKLSRKLYLKGTMSTEEQHCDGAHCELKTSWDPRAMYAWLPWQGAYKLVSFQKKGEEVSLCWFSLYNGKWVLKKKHYGDDYIVRLTAYFSTRKGLGRGTPEGKRKRRKKS